MTTTLISIDPLFCGFVYSVRSYPCFVRSSIAAWLGTMNETRSGPSAALAAAGTAPAHNTTASSAFAALVLLMWQTLHTSTWILSAAHFWLLAGWSQRSAR